MLACRILSIRSREWFTESRRLQSTCSELQILQTEASKCCDVNYLWFDFEVWVVKRVPPIYWSLLASAGRNAEARDELDAALSSGGGFVTAPDAEKLRRTLK